MSDSSELVPPRLRVNGLRVELPSGADVIADVSLEVAASEILGVVGESGSGKTTFAHALLGHTRRGLRIAEGSVELDGKDILALSSAELARVRGAEIAYVPQDPSSALNPVLKVGPQLREMLSMHPVRGVAPEERLAQVLGEVKLAATPELLRRYPHQLSGGQQQRVALAMAFLCRPRLIVLDEPTTGLDVTTQRHVLETIRSLCGAYGVGAVYVSHDLAVVAELVQHVAVMYAGRVVEIGATATVFAAAAHPYTSGLLRAVPSVERAEQLEGIDGQPPSPGRRPPGCSFAPRCEAATDECRVGAIAAVDVGNGHLVRCIHAARGVVRARPQLVSVTAAKAASSDAVVAAEGVSARYARTEVLHQLSFEVAPNSCLAIVGESGSGKTTLARCIVGMHPNWSGRISFLGEDLAPSARQRAAHLQSDIQYVFQNPYTSLNPRKTIAQLVAQPLQHFQKLGAGEARDRVVDVLENVSLSSSFMSRYPGELSGGERQRVAIARALIVEPSLLVCDEVTSALDVSVQAVIVELLRHLQTERRLAMVFITHNLALVRSIAQHVLVLADGRVVEEGRTEDVLDHPKRPYTAALMEDVPRLEPLDLADAR